MPQNSEKITKQTTETEIEFQQNNIVERLLYLLKVLGSYGVFIPKKDISSANENGVSQSAPSWYYLCREKDDNTLRFYLLDQAKKPIISNEKNALEMFIVRYTGNINIGFKINEDIIEVNTAAWRESKDPSLVDRYQTRRNINQMASKLNEFLAAYDREFVIHNK